MTTTQILLAIAIGLFVSEFSEVCPWAARKLIRWSAHHRYAPPARAELRAEELAAYLDDRPGRLFKLITALSFAAAAVVTRKIAPAQGLFKVGVTEGDRVGECFVVASPQEMTAWGPVYCHAV